MKNKILLMLLAVVTLLCGCSENQVTPPAPPMETFMFEVSELTPSTFLATITPKDPAMTYIHLVFDKESFDKYGSKEGVKVWIEATIRNRQVIYPDKSRAEIIEEMISTGLKESRRLYLEPESTLYIFAIGIDSDANTTTELFSKQIVMPAAYGEAPTVTKFEVAAGDANGEDQTNYATARVGATNVEYGQYGFYVTESINAALEDGLTYDDFYLHNELTAEDINDLASGEFVRTVLGAPDIDVTFIFHVIGDGGRRTVVHKNCIMKE